MKVKYEPFITVVVTVYNSEKYINKCLYSIHSQEYQNWECIIINDKSTDNSEEIILSWCEKDDRFRYILNDINQGVSRNRNIGIEQAKGEYITFIDSDDWVLEGYIRDFILHLEDENTLLVQDITKVYPEGKKEESVLNFKNEILHFREDYKVFFSNIYYTLGYINKLFSVNIIRKNNLMFLDNVSNEDYLFYLEYILCINRIKFLKYAHYQYLQRIDSRDKISYFMPYFNYLDRMGTYLKKVNSIFENRDRNFIEEYSKQKFNLLFWRCLRYYIYSNRYLYSERRKYLKLLRGVLIKNGHLVDRNVSLPKKIDLFLIEKNILFLADLFLKFRIRFV